MNKIVQCELRSENKRLVSWLDSRPDLKVGTSVTLKSSDEPKRLWEVLSVGQEHDRKDIKRGWGMTDYFGKEADRT